MLLELTGRLQSVSMKGMTDTIAAFSILFRLTLAFCIATIGRGTVLLHQPSTEINGGLFVNISSGSDSAHPKWR